MLVSIVGYHFLKQPSLKQYQMCRNDFRLWIVKWAPSFSEGSKNFLLVYVATQQLVEILEAYSKYSTVLRNSQCSLGHFVADPAEGSNFAHLRISMAIWLKAPLSVSQQGPCFPMAWELTWKHATRIASFGHIGSYLFFQTSFTGVTMFHVVGDSSLQYSFNCWSWRRGNTTPVPAFSFPCHLLAGSQHAENHTIFIFTLLGAFLFIPFTAM